jgi:tRNA(Ile)-lysidine synthase
MSDGAAYSLAIDAKSFAQAMRSFAPFESRPLVAVAVSGGPDSLALLLLLDDWARARGGSVLALTVDHGLRPDSASEARQVGAWAAARGIAHETLPWIGDKPASGIQSAARQARYGLLSDACAARGILHLAVAHHADDQAETVLFRRDRNSGPTGLAGMTASRSLGGVRLIRPLLGWPKAALAATCARFGQAFVEDPSNSASRFARTSLRHRLADDADQRASLLADAASAAVCRIAQDEALAGLLGRIAEIRPDGVVLLDCDGWAVAGSGLRRASLAAALRTAGGRAYAPDLDAVHRLDDALRARDFAGVSLAGCVVRRWRDRILFCREPKRAELPVALRCGTWTRWDGRFLLRIDRHGDEIGGLTVGVLGARGYAALKRRVDVRVPSIAGAGFAAVKQGDRAVAVPSAGWAEEVFPTVEQHYLPLWPLSSETFTVVYAGPDIMSA